MVCQGFYLTSRLETVRTRSGHLGWDATLSVVQDIYVPVVISCGIGPLLSNVKLTSTKLVHKMLLPLVLLE